MKLEALQKAVATAREQARVHESKANQLTKVARTAKDQARQAKSKLKLAKQEAKRTRRAAKKAKRALTEALAISESARAEIAVLQNRLKGAGRKAERAHVKRKHSKPAVAAKRVASRSHSKAPKPVAAKRLTKPATPAKPLPGLETKRTKPIAAPRESGVQVPRDFDTKPVVAPTATPPEGDSAAAPGGDLSN
jgi:hypothetical protein